MLHFQPEWMLRIICALITGVVIGYERYVRSKEAGIRTHAIVAMASCIVMIVSKYGFGDVEKVDAARLAAQVISGVGFLGAGLIFVRNDSVHGLTTAAGIWGTCAIGLAFGAGMYVIGFAGGILLYLIEREFRALFPLNSTRNNMTLQVRIRPQGSIREISELIDSFGYGHSENHISSDGEGGWYIKTEINTHKEVEPAEVQKQFQQKESVIEAKIL